VAGEKERRAPFYEKSMMKMCFITGIRSTTLVLVATVLISVCCGAPKCTYSSAASFLKKYNSRADELQKMDTLASWEYETDMNKKHKKKTTELSGKTSKFATQSREEAKCLLDTDEGQKATEDEKRQLMLITRTASSKDASVNKEMSSLVSKMTAIYSQTKVCGMRCNIILPPNITGPLSRNRYIF